jgi:transglutaminase-like putative cysteine protease
MNYRIRHQTLYRYSEPAALSQNELYLVPRETAVQRVVQSRLAIDPEPQYRHRRIDYFGNTAEVFMVEQPHEKLTMTATSIVDTSVPGNLDPAESPERETVVQQLAAHGQPEVLDAYQFVFPSPLVPVGEKARTYVQASFPPRTPVLVGAMDLVHRIFSEFTYDKSATSVDTPIDKVLAERKGVCQDFAHLGIACLRSVGLAARYVSGYLQTLPPPGKPKLIGADASHAWLSLFVPDTGWVDLDPTNNRIPDETYVTIAWGRDYGDVTPVKGVVMGGGTHRLSVMVDVTAQA